MTTSHQSDPSAAAAAAPSLADSVRAFAEEVPGDERADALHQLFYGFYGRIAIIDRTTHELARWAQDDLGAIDDLPPSLAEALRDNALHVGRELFATRIRTMNAMAIVSEQLQATRAASGAADRFTLGHAVAYDEPARQVRSYPLDHPGAHPDLPYDPFAYEPSAEDGDGSSA